MRTAVVELKLLESVEGGGLEPAVQACDGEVHVVEVVRRDGEAAAGALMRGKNARDYAFGDVVGAEGEIWNDVQIDVERSGAPDVALAGGEHLRAGAVVGREKGDDVAEDAVREAADAVFIFLLFFLQSSPPLGSGDHRNG
jgi:hypothetical protein